MDFSFKEYYHKDRKLYVHYATEGYWLYADVSKEDYDELQYAEVPEKNLGYIHRTHGCARITEADFYPR